MSIVSVGFLPLTMCYTKIRVNMDFFCIVIPKCEEKVVGLVRYPTVSAPDSSSKSVITQCVDNAHVRSGSSLRVRCTSRGTWSSGSPECECDEGYRPVPVGDRQKCEGSQICVT